MILIIYRSQVCREIVLPNADNTDYRIFIDSKEFKLKKSFYLSLEVIAHKWSITNENGEYKIVKIKLNLKNIPRRRRYCFYYHSRKGFSSLHCR